MVDANDGLACIFHYCLSSCRQTIIQAFIYLLQNVSAPNAANVIHLIIMKIVALFLALFATVTQASLRPFAVTTALQVRGGGEIGPLDGAMAMQLSKTVATAYVAGSASKYIAAHTGGSSTQVS